MEHAPGGRSIRRQASAASYFFLLPHHRWRLQQLFRLPFLGFFPVTQSIITVNKYLRRAARGTLQLSFQAAHSEGPICVVAAFTHSLQASVSAQFYGAATFFMTFSLLGY